MPARSAMMDNQQAVIAFLSAPSSYGPAIERVDIIETHVSLVFLAGDHAYKLEVRPLARMPMGKLASKGAVQRSIGLS